jgi:hypothetical protein
VFVCLFVSPLKEAQAKRTAARYTHRALLIVFTGILTHIERRRQNETQLKIKYGCLLGRSAKQSGRNLPTFQRCLLSPHQGRLTN